MHSPVPVQSTLTLSRYCLMSRHQDTDALHTQVSNPLGVNEMQVLGLWSEHTSGVTLCGHLLDEHCTLGKVLAFCLKCDRVVWYRHEVEDE
jgi:hypothetical protein